MKKQGRAATAANTTSTIRDFAMIAVGMSAAVATILVVISGSLAGL